MSGSKVCRQSTSSRSRCVLVLVSFQIGQFADKLNCAPQRIFSRVRIDGFGFDLESLFIARQLKMRIEQVPVLFRYNDEPTTVRFLRDGGKMAIDLARIRVRGWSGEYRAVDELRVSEDAPLVSVPASDSAAGQPA